MDEVSFRETLRSKPFVVTMDAMPPKGTDISTMLRSLEGARGRVDGVNVTEMPSAVMRLGSLPVYHILLESGFEPILQVTCRDRNRLALQSDLLGAAVLGIENVLILGGDDVALSDHAGAKGVFDLDSLQLLRTIRLMESGKDLGGNDLDGAVEFCAGATVTPEAQPLEPQLIKFEKKIEAGAEFFQTQGIYDLDNFAKFMKHARQFPVKILAGIILLSSARMAKFMTANVPGIFVPQSMIDELAATPKEEMLNKGIKIAGRMIAALKKDSICDGVHIMAIGKEEVVPDILAAAGL